LIPVLLAAAAGAALSFNPSSQVVPAAGTGTVSVEVDAAAADLQGFSLVVQVDSTVVRPVAVQPGALLQALVPPCDHVVYWLDPPDSVSSSTTVSFDGAGLGCSVDGPGAIADLEFECLREGISPVVFTAFDLRDSFNAGIPVTSTTFATIQCGEQISVRGESWGRVKARYHDPGGS
jgi:hypothetical protein